MKKHDKNIHNVSMIEAWFTDGAGLQLSAQSELLAYMTFQHMISVTANNILKYYLELHS